MMVHNNAIVMNIAKPALPRYPANCRMVSSVMDAMDQFHATTCTGWEIMAVLPIDAWNPNVSSLEKSSHCSSCKYKDSQPCLKVHLMLSWGNGDREEEENQSRGTKATVQ